MPEASSKRSRRYLDGRGGKATRLRDGKRDPVRYAPYELRIQVLQRDGFRCRYCKCDLRQRRANIDHVVPWAKGGRTSIENLVSACADCNKRKLNSMGIKPKSLKHVLAGQTKTPEL